MNIDTVARLWIAFLFIVVWPILGVTTIYVGFKFLNWVCRILFGRGL